MRQLDYVLNNEKEVLTFLKSHYPMYHLSNIFFRDIQYGIRTMFERKGERVSYTDGEKIARAFVEKLEKEKIFNKIDKQSWALNYPEFKKPVVVQATPAKPAPGAAPAKSPAATPGAARPSLPPLGGAKPATPSGARPALPPLGSAKPVDGTKPVLPPLSSAKPVGAAKPTLPPLTSAKPVSSKAATPAPAEAASNPTQQDVTAKPVELIAEQPSVEVAQPVSVAPTPAPTGQKKSLPPLKGNYTPASKK